MRSVRTGFSTSGYWSFAWWCSSTARLFSGSPLLPLLTAYRAHPPACQPARASRHPGVFCHAGVGEARASGPEFHRFLASDPCRWAAICVNRCDSQVSCAEASVSFAPPYFFLINQTSSLPTHSFSSRHCWPFVLLFWAIRCWHFQGGRLTCPFASSLSLLFSSTPDPSLTPREDGAVALQRQRQRRRALLQRPVG